MLFSTAFLITVLSELGFALPQSSNSKNGTGNGNNNNNNDNGPKMFTAADGSMVLDQTAQIKYVQLYASEEPQPTIRH